MEAAATQDLDGLTVLAELLSEVAGRTQPVGVSDMLAQLSAWYGSGAHRMTSAPTDIQYQQAPAVAIMDELHVNLLRQIFDPPEHPVAEPAHGPTGRIIPVPSAAVSGRGKERRRERPPRRPIGQSGLR